MPTAHSVSSNQFSFSRKLTFVVVLALPILSSIIAPYSAEAAAGGIQVCEPGAACEIGEFLYDDEYSPIADASCTITSRYPNETIYITEGTTMNSNTDGWYSYLFTAPTTVGLYRTEVCCTAGTDYLCLDKSFEVKADPSMPSTGDIASAVWGYSDRTLSSLGTLVRDIWLHSNRSLTSLTTSSTTSSTSGDLGDLAQIKKTTQENRLLLEELVNKPIIETYLEEEGTPDLGAKLDQTRSTANQLFANNEYLRSKTDLVISRWNSYSEEELMSILADLDNVLGEETDSPSQSSFFAQANWLKTAWNWDEAENVFNAATNLKRIIGSTKITVSSYGKSSLAYQNMRSLGKLFDAVELAIGDSTDTGGNQTLFSHYREVSDLATLFENQIADIDRLLANWQGTDPTAIRTNLNATAQKAIPINRIPQLRSYLGLASAGLTDKELKNKAFSVRGVLDTNRIMLARPAGSPLANTWLELGSIVFKTVVTNPSPLITQEVPLKYYLPPEVREEHILNIDEGLEVKYDSEKDQYYVSGNFKLSPGEAITLKVSIDDIWVVKDSEVESLKGQAEELMRPLEKTSYFAQGVTLKSDIDVSLDKILALQSAAVTPEAKIRAFREAKIELNSVFEKIDGLKDLVTQAGQAGALFGFVGGVQAIAVWGLIIIMAAGFVFLALYMKVLRGHEEKEKKAKPGKGTPPSLGGFTLPKFVRTAMAFIIFGAFVSGTTTAIVLKVTAQAPETEVLGRDDVQSPAEPEPETQELPATGGEEIIMITVPDMSSLNLRDSADGKIVGKLTHTLEAVRVSEEGDWTEVLLKFEEYADEPQKVWISSEFVTAPRESESEVDTVGEITIGETPTGWLNVRSIPGGEVRAQVNPGETYPVLNETDSWYQIRLSDGEGWVSKTYIVK